MGNFVNRIDRLKAEYSREGIRAFFKRGPWEMVATITIGLGVFMLMQPFALWLYTYSLITILVGTIAFVIVSHFPE